MLVADHHSWGILASSSRRASGTTGVTSIPGLGGDIPETLAQDRPHQGHPAGCDTCHLGTEARTTDSELGQGLSVCIGNKYLG